MEILDLNGTWELTSPENDYRIHASIPGCVHLDLLKADVIPDPYYRDNEDRLHWIGETTWIFQRRFTVSPRLLGRDRVLLQCQGLDTFAEILINGQPLGTADNMFRTWEFDLRDLLKEGDNAIEVRFAPVMPYARQKQEEHFLWHTGIGHHRLSGGNWIRKEQCNFGWDWGPELVTCGIWRDIRIIAFNSARLDQVSARQVHSPEGKVDLHLAATVESADSASATRLRWQLNFNGRTVADNEAPVSGGRAGAVLRIPDPQLWWPNGMGDHPLYEWVTILEDATGLELDRRTHRLGLRTFDLVRETDQWGQSFHFRVNGRDFFAKGANWIPADTFDCRVSDDDLRDLVQSAADVHMNCLRVWGGGLYERDSFYDICDELGIMVWQDFMFACSAYPAHEKSFLENVRVEAAQNIARLRHHPSIALWCGNNELEQIHGILGDDHGQMRWHHYCAFFDDLLAGLVGELDPGRPYWPSSEHSPIGDRLVPSSTDPRWGDAHLWEVWHGRKPFEWYRTSFHRFCSEFGFQSFPHPATVESYTLPEERNITSHVMERHQRSPIGNSAIIDYLLSWFRLPVGWEHTVWLSQVLQGLAIQYAVEHWRRNMPRCMGAIYWQLNDCWPVASWASIDSAHRWKALHFAAARFFAPDMVSSVEDPESGTLDIFLTSDSPESRPATITVIAEAPDGTRLLEHSVSASTPAAGSVKVDSIDCSKLLEKHSPRGLVFFLELALDGRPVHRNLALFSRPKHIPLESPELATEILSTDDVHTEVKVSSDKPALWVWLSVDGDPDARFSDNFFHLAAGQSRTITIASAGPLDPDTLRLRNLTDTYSES